MRFAAMVVVVLMASVVVVSAQTPFIAVYFDQSYQAQTPLGSSCPGIDVPGTLYIALLNANVFVTGVEFAVDYPPEMTWVADLNKQPVTVGTTPTGFSMGWSLPQNGFSPIDICEVLFTWNCDGCAVTNIPIVVIPSPITGFLGFTDFPDNNLFPAVGLTSLICPTIPTEKTSWGKVKSLYGE
jgi:hypothetical protein